MDEQPQVTAALSLSRRDALKRGAVIVGALAWTAPAVQAVSMTAAHAESTSAPRSSSGLSRPAPESGFAGGGTQDSQLSLTGVGAPVVGAAAEGAGLMVTGATVAAVVAKASAASATTAAGAAGGAGAGGTADAAALPPSSA
jgi:hypothetical protein